MDREEKIDTVKKCRFMAGLQECRQMELGTENFEICKLCILGRMEAHLFDLIVNASRLTRKDKFNKEDNKEDFNKDKKFNKKEHWSERED